MPAQALDTDRSPRDVIAEMLQGAWVCQALSTITRLSIPDLLNEHGPLTAEDLTEHRGVAANAGLLRRVLRACASSGVLTEDQAGRFGATALSNVLTSGSPMKRFAELYGAQWWEPWGRLIDVVSSEQPRARRASRRNEAEIVGFAEAMAANVSLVPALLEACRLPDDGVLVDVGGGFGHMSIAVLGLMPGMRALVLDLPEVIAVAERRRSAQALPERLSFVGGDMFEEVPAGDLCLVSRVLHDWDDVSCTKILQNCRRALPPGGIVICLDVVMPPLGDTSASSAKYLDLLMLATLPGKERTEQEWFELFQAANMRLRSITLIDPRTRVSALETRV